MAFSYAASRPAGMLVFSGRERRSAPSASPAVSRVPMRYPDLRAFSLAEPNSREFGAASTDPNSGEFGYGHSTFFSWEALMRRKLCAAGAAVAAAVLAV